MNVWQTITGSDLTGQWRSFEARAEVLPGDHRAAWEQIKAQLASYSDFSGRNLIPILDNVLGLLEEAAAEGQGAREVLGDDIAGFCAAIAGGQGALSFRDRWRQQLNRSVATKLGRQGD